MVISKSAGVDKILPKMDKVGVLWLSCLFSVVQKSGALPLKEQNRMVDWGASWEIPGFRRGDSIR